MPEKLMHDGSFVPMETPTKLVNGKRYLLSQEELAARQAEEDAEAEYVSSGRKASDDAKANLRKSDLEDLPRIAEDIWAALVAKGVVSDADLPDEAVAKLTSREELRRKIK